MSLHNNVRISEVPVGSIVQTVRGARKVLQNKIFDLVVELEAGSPIGVNLSSWEPSRKGPTATVPVIALAGQAPKSLSDELAERFGKRPQPQPSSSSAPSSAPDISEIKIQLEARKAAQSATQGITQAVSETLNRQAEYIRSVERATGHQVKSLIGRTDDQDGRIEEVEDGLVDVEQRVYGLEQKQRHSEIEARINAATATTKTKTNTQGGISMSIKNILGGFTSAFGKVDGQFALSAAGLAVRKNPNSPAPNWVAYDKAKNIITDVAGLVLDVNIPAFSLPVASDQVKNGDIVVNNGAYQYVTEVNDGYVKTVSPATNQLSTVMPVNNLVMGKAFYTVIQTLADAGTTGFNPMLLMALGKGGDKKDLLPLLLMSGGLGGQAGAQTPGAIDPMMLMLLGDKVDDLLPLVLMQQGAGQGAQGLQGILPLLLLSGDKGGDTSDLLPLLAMSGGLGGQAGGANNLQSILPLLLLGDKGGDKSDLLPLLMMGGLNGGQNPFGNLFGGQATTAPVAAPVVQTPVTDAPAQGTTTNE